MTCTTHSCLPVHSHLDRTGLESDLTETSAVTLPSCRHTLLPPLFFCFSFLFFCPLFYFFSCLFFFFPPFSPIFPFCLFPCFPYFSFAFVLFPFSFSCFFPFFSLFPVPHFALTTFTLYLPSLQHGHQCEPSLCLDSLLAASPAAAAPSLPRPPFLLPPGLFQILLFLFTRSFVVAGGRMLLWELSLERLTIPRCSWPHVRSWPHTLPRPHLHSLSSQPWQCTLPRPQYQHQHQQCYTQHQRLHQQ